jgi:hypothetical protein
VPLLFDRTNVVRISAHGSQAVGELLRVTDGDSEDTIKLDREPKTTPFKIG